ncbi:MAG TPA: hypothetical protein VF053_09055 [Streptosporangiales bacterium]
MRLLLFLVAVVCLACGGAWLHLRRRSRLRAERAGLFRDVRGLFTDVTVVQDDVDFPVLRGTRHGYRWLLRPVVDSLSFRTLPTLWLCLTCQADLEVPAPVSVLLRPSGNEFYSANGGYPHELPLPDGCPAYARAASPDARGADVPLGPVGALLGEAETKEVAVAQGGVRVVRRVSTADPGRYRVGRRIDLGTPVLTPDDVLAVLTRMAATARSLQEVPR